MPADRALDKGAERPTVTVVAVRAGAPDASSARLPDNAKPGDSIGPAELAGATQSPPEVAGGAKSNRRTVAVLAVLLVLALLLLGGDRWLRHREFDTLLDRVTAGQATAVYADRRVVATVGYSSPLIGSASVSPQVRRGLQQLVQQSAADQLGPLRAARDSAANTRVLPWHHAQRQARAQSIAYLDGRLSSLTAVSESFAALYVAHPEIAQRRAAARRALQAAAPDLAGAAQAARALP